MSLLCNSKLAKCLAGENKISDSYPNVIFFNILNKYNEI